MSKTLKKILVAGTSLLMFTSIGASTSNINVNAKRHVRTYRVYRHRSRAKQIKRIHSNWRNGTPWVFHKNSYWISDYRKISNSYHNYYVKVFSPFSYKYGFDPTKEFYNKRHRFTMGSADESAFASINPHYRALGNNWYLITSGASPARKSLYYELHNTLNHDFGSTSLVKVHNRKSVSIWTYGNHGKKYYQGYFHPYTYNYHILFRVLGR